jgi:hypothetical protein
VAGEVKRNKMIVEESLNLQNALKQRTSTAMVFHRLWKLQFGIFFPDIRQDSINVELSPNPEMITEIIFLASVCCFSFLPSSLFTA